MCCLCGRGISFVGVVFTSVSVVLPFQAFVVISVGVAITSEGVDLTFSGVILLV